MNATTGFKLKKIERISTVLRAVCSGVLPLVGVLFGLAIVATLAGHHSISITVETQAFAVAGMNMRSRLILATALLASGVVLGKAVYHLRQLLDNYSRQEIFTAASARQIRNFGLSCILWGALKIGWALLPFALLSNASHSFQLSLDSLVIGFVVIGISWFAEMAAELREENELTI